jgi:hypothetical protein
MVFIASGVHAACNVPPVSAPLDQQLALLPDCQRNAAYLAQIGHLLNAQGNYTDALEHLERALMFEPDLVGAQLDYAIALAGSGDMLSARQLLEAIITQPDLSPDMRQAVADAHRRMHNQNALAANGAVANGALAFHSSVQLRRGYDNNLLGSPSLTSLELTFPGELVVLPLTDSNTPRPGAYTRTEAKLEWTQPNPDGTRWDLAANLMQRVSAAAPESDTRQSEISFEYTPQTIDTWGVYWNTSRMQLSTEGGTQYASTGVNVGVQTAARRTCSVRLGGDWQDRQLTSNPILSGRYAGLASLWSCSMASGAQWQLAVKAGQDRPLDATRPGGEQFQANVRLAATWPMHGLADWARGLGVFNTAGTGLMDIEFSHTQDTTGYSALLANYAVRGTQRVNARLEYQHRFSQRAIAMLGIERSHQDSNLPLFRIQNSGTYAALKLLW